MNSPTAIATALVARLGINGKPNLGFICHQLGLRVRGGSSTGFDGILIRGKTESKGIIGIRDAIGEPSRKRFTIAHEIGHFVIPSHKYLPNSCESNQIDSYRSYLPKTEQEANEFAAELLLPSKSVAPVFRSNDVEPSLEVVSRIARQFSTSLSATARRLVDLRDDALALVWQENGKVCWLYKDSKKFPFYLAKNSLPVRSKDSLEVSKIRDIAHGFRCVEPIQWLDAHGSEIVDSLFEHSLYLPRYRAVISLLWMPREFPRFPDEEDLLEELSPCSFTIDREEWPR